MSLVDLLAETLGLEVAAQPWRAQAACRGLDPEFFYAGRGEFEEWAEAKAVCRLCPVRLECLEHALDACERFGVWGGLSHKERRLLKRSRRGAA